MFQMNYLYFTSIKKDEQAFNTLINQYKMAEEQVALARERAFRLAQQYSPRSFAALQVA